MSFFNMGNSTPSRFRCRRLSCSSSGPQLTRPATPIIDWPVMKRKITRKANWMPSDRRIKLLAQEIATEAASRMSVYYLMNRINTEFMEAYKDRRPYLDDRKIELYAAVVNAVNRMVKKFERAQLAQEKEEKEEEEDENEEMDCDSDSDISSAYSGISSSDLPIPLCLVDTGKGVDEMHSSSPPASGSISPAATFGVRSPRTPSPDVTPARSASPGMSSPNAAIIG
ncbi:hypothetical protein QBC39DRAFT_328573 [Podospora conica]|nr:hypothetical protein QBC39DRAFT_328573 [Schizothecium conicum]